MSVVQNAVQVSKQEITLKINILVLLRGKPNPIVVAGSSLPNEIGTNISTFSKVLVNAIDKDQYTINMALSDIALMNPDAMAKTIVGLFEKNLPNIPVRCIIEWFTRGQWDEITDGADQSRIDGIGRMAMDRLISLCQCIERRYPMMRTTPLGFPKVKKTDDGYEYSTDDDEYDDEDEDDIDPFDEYDYDDDDEGLSYEDLIEGLYDDIGNLARSAGGKKKRYPTSRVVKNAKRPKRLYHRHGVMISRRSDIDKDRNTIKSFLKDFIPGNERWKKDFRRDLCDRWIKTFVVTNKKMKALEKAHRHKAMKKGSNDKTAKAIEYTRKLLAVPIDRWNDPSK